MSPSTQPRRTFEVITPNPMSIWLRDYLLDVRAANRSEATIGFYKQKLIPFIEFLQTQGVTQPEQIGLNRFGLSWFIYKKGIVMGVFMLTGGLYVPLCVSWFEKMRSAQPTRQDSLTTGRSGTTRASTRGDHQSTACNL